MIFVLCVCISFFHITGYVQSFPEFPNMAIFLPGKLLYLRELSCMTTFLNSGPDQ